MKYSKTWAIFLLFIYAVLFYIALPTFIPPKNIESQENKYWGVKGINMGLDLRGGVSIVVGADIDSYIDNTFESLSDNLEDYAHKNSIKLKSTSIHDELEITFPQKIEKEDIEKVKKALDKLLCVHCYTIQLRNMNFINVKINDNFKKIISSSLINRTMEIIKKRIDDTGAKEIEVSEYQSDKILIQIPGVFNTEEVKKMLESTAKLTFQEVVEGDVVGNTEELELAMHTNGQERDNEKKNLIKVYKKNIIDGSMIMDARATSQKDEYCVSFSLNSKGSTKFANYTKNNKGKILAIVLDGKIISAPVIRDTISSGNGIISGKFSAKEAGALATMLRSGALPTQLVIEEERVVGAALGEASIKSGKVAVIIALIVVMIFMILFYGIWGIFANVALITNLITIISLLLFMDATLTLAGIAGIVLTIGMAVDANILIFERMKELEREMAYSNLNFDNSLHDNKAKVSKEDYGLNIKQLNRGKTLIDIIQRSYKESFRTILDANLTTVIAAIALYVYGSGVMKGFAITLILGIISSIFNSITITKLLCTFWFNKLKPSKLYL